jgi:hypothetical protein
MTDHRPVPSCSQVSGATLSRRQKAAMIYITGSGDLVAVVMLATLC